MLVSQRRRRHFKSGQATVHHGCRRQILSVEVMLHSAKRGEKFLKVCTFRLQRYKLSDLPNRPVKYLKTVGLNVPSFPGDRPAFVACSSLCEMCISSLIPTHLTAKILIAL